MIFVHQQKDRTPCSMSRVCVKMLNVFALNLIFDCLAILEPFWPHRRSGYHFDPVCSHTQSYSHSSDLFVPKICLKDVDEMFTELLKYGYPPLALHGGQDVAMMELSIKQTTMKYDRFQSDRRYTESLIYIT